jgi:hypothetical protein
MSQLNQNKNDSNPEKIYYDIQIANVENSNSDPPILYFNESRNTPFINVPQDYYLSIIRFTLDTYTLPIFIPTIQTNLVFNPTQNPNQTIYSFQFSYNGVYSNEIFIEWVPQNSFLSTPPFVNTGGILTQDLSTSYYECYTFEYFISLINQQLLTAFNTFKASIMDFPDTAVAPIIAWDSSQNIARLIFEESFLNSAPTPIYFYMNSPLYNLFGSFNVIRNGFTLTNGRNFQILVLDFRGFNTYQYTNYITGDTFNVIEVIQEYSTISAWSPITAIVFTSNTLPIVSNQISKPTIFVEGSVLGNYGNNSNFQQIITDMVTDDAFYKPNICYNPSAQYRLIDLFGNTPLTNVDISVFWKSRVGNLVPFRLGSGATATIKLLFTKKSSENYK